ncbi:Phox homologous domain-containing protein [Neocallimastix lanati (nom. inval.)]|nr:Phox homologous domain-containing protein [Neocallimastix sp. JGI-2020a]
MEKILKISIPNCSQRQKSKPYMVYHISITTTVRSWTVQHRYNEFFNLNKKFLDLGLKPPLELPPKSFIFSFTSFDNPKFVENRRQGLEEYLQAVLASKDERFKKLPEWKEFLENQADQGKNSLDLKSSEQWLDECRDLNLVINEIRTCIAERNKFAFRNDTAAACEAIVQARKNHNVLCTRYSSLERELHCQKPLLSKGELSRRQDLLENIRVKKEQLEKQLRNIKFNEDLSFDQMVTTSNNSVYYSSKVNSSIDNGLSNSSINHNTSGKFKSRRKFGVNISQEVKEKTQGLDNVQILQLQKDMLNDQDKTLEQFSAILNRQHRLGETINQEFSLQSELLEDLDGHVNKVNQGLSQADKRMKKVLKK